MQLKFLTILGLFITVCTTAQTSKTDWTAKWIEIGYAEDSLNRPAQYFQKEFQETKKIASAKLYITSHGLYEAHINGKRVGDAYLTPGWTSYHKRLQYQEYDVSSLIQKGSNKIGVTLGDGWWRSVIGFENKGNFYGRTLALLCELEITYSNGKKQRIPSDGSWTCSPGNIRFSEIYHGETIDASVNSGPQAKVVVKDYGYANLIPTENEPVKKHEEFKPVKFITTPSGERVVDFGQNLVGWVKVKISGNAGDSIVIKHAEVLDKAGNFYLANLRNAKATATYVLKGNGEESFEPHFTFFGFRYIRIDGYTGELKPENFTAVALYSAMKPTGKFECSNPLLNQLQHNIQWGQRGNFLDVPTDCPQRDERLGWTGDAQAFSRTASFNFDVEHFFRKWLKDVAADQRADGAVPSVIPDVLNGFGGSTGWSEAATIIPWNMYLAYGDLAALEQQYPMMKKWVGFMEQNSVNDLWNKGYHFGDWLSYHAPDDDGTDAITDKYQIAQCFYAHSTQLVINAARVLGKTDDVAKYEALLAKVKAAFLKEYVTPNTRMMSNTQTAYVLALQFDMLPEDKRPVAAKYLVENIQRYNNHLTTGFLGSPYLCHVLSRFGYTDVAYKLLLQETYPGWLYPVKMGATTIWERWDGIKPDGSFQNPGMNSFNHYAYGAIGDWMYRVIAGIDTDSLQVGYKKIIIRPHPGGGLTYVNAEYESKQGKIIVHWKMSNGRFTMDVTIPPGTTADVYLPSSNGTAYSKSVVQPGLHHFE